MGEEMNGVAKEANLSTGFLPAGSERRSVAAARWIVTLGALASLAWAGVAYGADIRHNLGALVVWVLLVGVADFHAVSLREWSQFSISFPLLLAAALALGPFPAALVAVAGYVDRRELRGEVGLARACFNRAQVALSVLLASVVFAELGVDLDDWPAVIAASLVALAADFMVNALCVASINALRLRAPIRRMVRHLFPERGVGDFIGTYVCLGATGLVMATLFRVAGVWGLLVSFAPLFFAAKMLEKGESLERAQSDLRRKDEGLVAATRRMESERRDERAVLAASLHDDVLPPLFKVQLMADVVKRDLESGALLDLEADLAAMLGAAEITAEAIRGLVGGLRKAGLGPGGLVQAVRTRAREVEARSRVRVTLDIRDIPSDPVIELVAYQVVREALENAGRHGEASIIVVSIGEADSGFRLAVRDDGVGFTTSAPGQGPEGHFGLILMHERVAAIGGSLSVESNPGQGTRVVAWLPSRVGD